MTERTSPLVVEMVRSWIECADDETIGEWTDALRKELIARAISTPTVKAEDVTGTFDLNGYHYGIAMMHVQPIKNGEKQVVLHLVPDKSSTKTVTATGTLTDGA